MTAAGGRIVEACQVELKVKQNKLPELVLFPERQMLGQHAIELGMRGRTFLRVQILLIGSLGLQSKTWLWAWNNPGLEQKQTEKTTTVREFGLAQGFEAFGQQAAFASNERQAWDFAAVACHAVDALGVFRETANDTDWFFVVMGMERTENSELYDAAVEHLINETIVEGGSTAKINLLRDNYPDVVPSVIEADLRGEANPWAHDLHTQIIYELPYPDDVLPPFQKRRSRVLSGVNLSRVRLDGVNLRGLELFEANLDGAVLIDADLTRADLRGASFRGAWMSGANLTSAALAGADFAGAQMGRTLLTNVDLSEVKNLCEIEHVGSSEIGMSTLLKSRFKIDRRFLKAAGVTRGLLEDLERGKRFPDSFQTCFLSYSSADREFAAALYDALIEAGVRVFWDQVDMLPGDRIEAQLAESIAEHDRFLVVLSESSMKSNWVRKELEMVWHGRKESLIPVRLCSLEQIQAWTSADSRIPKFADEMNIADFSSWKEGETFDRQLQLLLRGLGGKRQG